MEYPGRCRAIMRVLRTGRKEGHKQREELMRKGPGAKRYRQLRKAGKNKKIDPSLESPEGAQL